MSCSKNPNPENNPKIFGPILWSLIHRMARSANTKTKKVEFCIAIRVIGKDLGCGECAEDTSQYINDHPPEKLSILVDINGIDITMLKWSYVFHHHVNVKTKNKTPEWAEIYNKYITPEYIEEVNGSKRKSHDQRKKLSHRKNQRRSENFDSSDEFDDYDEKYFII